MDKITSLNVRRITRNRRLGAVIIFMAVTISLEIYFGDWVYNAVQSTIGFWVCGLVYVVFAAAAFGLIVFEHFWDAPPYFCSECDKHLSNEDNWTCSYCNSTNQPSKFDYIVEKCGKCSREPKSVICPHCETLNFFDSDRDGKHPAKIVVAVVVRSPAPDPKVQSKNEHLAQKEKIEREIELTALTQRLAQLKASAEFKQEISGLERIGKKYSVFETEVLGARMFERTERMKNARELRDNPDLFEQKELAMDAFIEQEGLTPTRLTDEEKGTA